MGREEGGERTRGQTGWGEKGGFGRLCDQECKCVSVCVCGDGVHLFTCYVFNSFAYILMHIYAVQVHMRIVL